ncbi:MAG: outer membrane protein assembly factor BamA [Bdellovibrionales bacterium]|nr:outer membrane protein assembly factor BamA [Bdellovibrionales bacterium]
MSQIVLGFLLILFVPWLAQGQETTTDRAPSARSTTKKKTEEAATAIVRKISVKGMRKIEEDAVRSRLTTRVGEPFDLENIRLDVRELFKTGYFYDVTVDRSDVANGVELTYILLEKPSIVSIEYKGNTELDDTELKEASGMKVYQILDYPKIQEAIEKMEKLYEDKGFFLAKIKYEIKTEKEGESVALHFVVEENEMVRVKRISFIGNKQLKAGKLKSVMATQEGGFFSFMSGSGAYKQDAFDRDLQILNYLYFNEGFVQVKIDRPQVYVTPDKKGIFVSIRIDEGERFDIGTVDFTGDLLFPHDELNKEVEVKEGEQFVYETLQKDLRTLQAKYGDLGYAFANIIPRTSVREKDRRVDVTFEIDKGNKVYIGRINMLGNTKTRDKVIRRELEIREGELYNETRKRQSIDAVRRLGYFDEVNFNTKTPKGENDRMDVDIVVKERNTGTIQVGAGYSSFAGFVFNGQVNQSNLFGKGQKLGVSIDISKKQSLFNINFTEPYFMDSQWSVGFDAYQSKRILSEYEETKKGGAIRIGHPLAPFLRGYVRYKLDDTEIKLAEEGDPQLFPVETVNGVTSSMTLTLEYDQRNDRFAPTEGIFSSASVEYAGLGGDLEYTKGFGTFRYYKKVFWDVVWRNNLTYGFLSSNNSDKEPPFNELFLLGGANSLRGFDWFSVGKRKYSQKAYNEAIAAGDPLAEYSALRPFGGTQQLFYNLEFQFPLIDEAGIKGVVFYDIGNADDELLLSDFRSDVGFGFRWFSPIGPLRFEWGFPFERKEQFREDSVNFQFAIGAPF